MSNLNHEILDAIANVDRLLCLVDNPCDLLGVDDSLGDLSHTARAAESLARIRLRDAESNK